jgi:hypothetical protein
MRNKSEVGIFSGKGIIMFLVEVTNRLDVSLST